MPQVEIDILSIRCNDTEDFSGPDHVYYMAFLECSTRRTAHFPDPVPVNAKARYLWPSLARPLEITDGESKSFPAPYDKLFPVLSSHHGGNCESEHVVTGSVYFFDSDTLFDSKTKDTERMHYILLLLDRTFEASSGHVHYDLEVRVRRS